MTTDPDRRPRDERPRTTLPADQIDSYEVVVELIRSGSAVTRPEIGRLSGLGRSIVYERVDQAIARGIVSEFEPPPTSVGRNPRQLQFAADRACILVGLFGALGLGVAVADLSGALIASAHSAWSIEAGPEASLTELISRFEELQRGLPHREVWGVTVGVPGPVEYATGRLVMPPIMPGWDGYEVRERLAERFDAPIWVDNDANLMALGEAHARGLDRTDGDLLFIKAGTGVGAGLVSGGRLHRGVSGGAGDIGHVKTSDFPDALCRCGRRGCLEATAGGWAMARDAEKATDEGLSPFLAARYAAEGILRPLDVAEGSLHGDGVCVDLVTRSGELVGSEVAYLASFFNPSVIALGGVMANTGDLFASTVKREVYGRTPLLATRELQIVKSTDDARVGLRGGAILAIEELFGRGRLRRWFAVGSPVTDPPSIYRRPALVG